MTKRLQSLLPMTLFMGLVGCAATAPVPTEPLQIVVEPATTSVEWTPPPTSDAVQASVEAAFEHADSAFFSSEDLVLGWRELPEEKSWRVILTREGVDAQHLSVGTTSSGTLQNAAELPAEGAGHAIIERHRNHGTAFGTPELVKAIERAGARVEERFPGAILRVGNLSRKRGGDIVWSNSHNSGRDADLAFYVHRAETQKVVPAPDLMNFDANGVSKQDPTYRFDVPRNWELVKALLEDDTITIQWLFVSIPLQQMMLAHAETIGESGELMARAEAVMHQPTDALPHDDHFHLRIGCSKADRLEGCIDWGPKWEWADWHEPELLARSLEIARAFQTETTPEERLAALAFLEEIKSPYRAEVALVWGVWDSDPNVRAEALDVADRAWPWSTAAIVASHRFIKDESTTLAEKAEAYSIIRRAQDPVGWEFAMARLNDPAVDAREKIYAARSLEHAMNPDLVPFLLEQLAQQPGFVRVELANVLMRVTNHSVDCDWANGGKDEVKTALASWNQWWLANRMAPREAWLLTGFRNLGVELEPNIGPTAVDKLLPLLKRSPEHVIYNVNRLVREVTGRWAPLEQVNGAKLYRYWIRWWSKNRSRVLSDS